MAVTEEELARAGELDAAKNMDWGQVVANGGPPCFALMKEGRFCGRAERWQGHGSAHHEFVSLEELLRVYARQEREAEREKLAQWMIRNSFATGHGDDIESLLVELKWQIAERGVQEREAERERIETLESLLADAIEDLENGWTPRGGLIHSAKKQLADRMEAKK
jgi:hypothetical protein